MLTLLLAGIDTAYFDSGRAAASPRGTTPRAPRAPPGSQRISLVLWILVVAFGRWIGFTKQ